MEFFPFTKLLESLIRWAHVMFAILWVGNSFLFNYLDYKLEKNKKNKEIGGEKMLIHSGSYYYLAKYKGVPKKLFTELIVFKYQSYLTFLTGVLLLILIYYSNAGILMVDKKVMDITPTTAVIISVLSVILVWLIYDNICKSKLKNYKTIFYLLLIIMAVIVAYISTEIFSKSYSYLHFGIVCGSVMFFNVFFRIIPNQKQLAVLNKKGKYDLNLSIDAKNRSIMNNLLTYITLWVMLSGHMSYLRMHQYNWIILVVIFIVSLGVRHYFNLRAQNKIKSLL